MLADDELRGLLTTRLPELRPDVETELERVLSRATTRARRRRAAYVGGLAAAVVAAVLVLGHDWRTQADPPDPVDRDRGKVMDLVIRGVYNDPAPVAAGRYRAFVVGSGAHIKVELDIPAGWGQDDVFAFATGAGSDNRTRRIDAFAGVEKIGPNPCTDERFRPAPGIHGLAVALTGLAQNTSTTPRRVTLDGYPAYFLRLHGHRAPSGSAPCTGGAVPRGLDDNVMVSADLSAWTSLVWVVDVEGEPVVLVASHGPGATTAQEGELFRIVGSASFVQYRP